MTYAPSESTISAILDAAECLFVDRSFASVSMQKIAASANLTKGALYHHFTSKEELYLAMMLRDLEEKRALSVQAAEVEGGVHERLRAHTLAFLKLPSNKRKLTQLVRRDINFFEGQTRKSIVRAYQAALPDYIEDIMRDGMKRGEIESGDPRLMAWSYVALVEVVMSDYAMATLGEPDTATDYVTNMFFSGVGKQIAATTDIPDSER